MFTIKSAVRSAIFLGLAAFIVYNLNFRVVGTGDSYSARVAPFAILTEGTLNLDSFKSVASRNHPTPYWLQPTLDGKIGSLFPVITPVLVTPLYVPVVAYLKATGWTEERLTLWSIIMEKISASVVASLAVAFIYLALRRRVSGGTALLLTVAFAFGTGTWSTSSQALWLHGAAELFLALALFLITGPVTAARAALAGASIAAIACNRPPDLFMAAAVALPALVWSGRKAPWYIAAGAAVSLSTLAYNYLTFGHLVGAWHVVGTSSFFNVADIPGGLAGLLFSPGRGLFVYTPFLLLLPLALTSILKAEDNRLLVRSLLAGIVVTLVFYATTPWHAGHSYGPRYMLDIVPALIWLIAPGVERLRDIRRMAYIGLICFSIWVEYVGAFYYAGKSNLALFEGSTATIFNTAPMWIPSNAQFLLEFKNGRQPGNLIPMLQRAL